MPIPLKPFRSVRRAISRPLSAPVAVTAALALLGAAIAYTREELRSALREQIAHRDGQLVEGVFRRTMATAGAHGDGDPLAALLETARMPELPGLWSIALFGDDLKWRGALPATAETTAIDPLLARIAREKGAAFRFSPNMDAGAEFLVPPEGMPEGRAATLEIVLILPAPGRPTGGGFARLLLDGGGLATEYLRLDTNLTRAAWTAFAAAGGAMATILVLAFRRLEQANRRLLRANRELALSAKTSAIGAVTSHMIHGIKNPLAGLHRFVAERTPEGNADEGWADAAEAARRMKAIIDDVTRVLRDEGDVGTFDLGSGDIMEMVAARTAGHLRSHKVRITITDDADCDLPNRDANLVLLVLENLAVNAIQATPEGGSVRLSSSAAGESVEFRVADSGGGLPEPVLETLFTPSASSKAGGTGLGLAISRQMALKLGGDLKLVRSDGAGAEFSLTLPRPGNRRPD
jgi:signal transduction histidine kinase